MENIIFQINKFWKEERVDIIIIILTTICFIITKEWVKQYATQYPEFAIKIPEGILVISVILYLIKLSLTYRKLSKLENIESKQPLKNRFFRIKRLVFSLNAFATLFVDLIIVYTISWMYLVFASSTNNEQIHHALERIQFYEIIYPIVAICTLFFIRKK